MFTMLAGSLDKEQPMTVGKLTLSALAAFVLFGQSAVELLGQAPPTVTFRGGVDVVRVAAVVRDHKGRFVQDLAARDFEVLDVGQPRSITDFRQEATGVSVAFLFDVSGSMEGHLPNAREAAAHLLSWLDAARDEAAVFAFDTRLEELAPYTTGLKELPVSMAGKVAFGETSLHDAIAQTARRAGTREGRRRAVVVLTDGADNASRLTPSEVSGIASEIDVPVYIFGIVPSIDNPSEDTATLSVARSALEGPLADLAAWTGGHVYVASTPGQRSVAARQIVDELRHQYLIAFESSGPPGWHPLIVRARNKDLTVRTRSGYIAGQSRPSSH
jgi:Ca-activated chloride channel homolog